MKKQDLCDTLQKNVYDKVPNFTDEDMNRKKLSGFLHIEKWRAHKPDMSRQIQPDNDLDWWYQMVPDNT